MILNIVPAGKLAPEIQALARNLGYTEFNFYDDKQLNYPSPSRMAIDVDSAIATGIPSLKRSIHQNLPKGLKFPTLLHSSAVLMDAENLKIGEGCQITAHCVLSTNVQIGKFNLINLNSTIGHDCVIGDFCSIMPGVNLSGGVKLEEEVYLGTNATVLPGLSIGKGATIGAGAVVTKNVPAGKTYIGVPAKEMTQA